MAQHQHTPPLAPTLPTLTSHTNPLVGHMVVAMSSSAWGWGTASPSAGDREKTQGVAAPGKNLHPPTPLQDYIITFTITTSLPGTTTTAVIPILITS